MFENYAPDIEIIDSKSVEFIDDELLKAYRSAKYVLNVNPVVEMKVDSHCSQLDSLLKERGWGLVAFITPENPYSEILSESENQKRHETFLNYLELQDYKSDELIGGYGIDIGEQWPRENSYLISVGSEEQATEIARQYDQNGYLLHMIDEATKLILCR